MIKQQAEKKGKKHALRTAEMRFDGREYKIPARLGKEAAAGVNTPYSHAFLRRKGYVLFLV